jgi:hypothetical protein
MKKMMRWSLVLLLGVLWVSCTSTITNLTVSKLPRTPSGLYPVEVDWDCAQPALVPGSVQPYVVIGYESYKMRPVLGMQNRWETVVPVAPDKTAVPYHIRFDYQYRKAGRTETSSQLSHGYVLNIMDK